MSEHYGAQGNYELINKINKYIQDVVVGREVLIGECIVTIEAYDLPSAKYIVNDEKLGTTCAVCDSASEAVMKAIEYEVERND